MDASSSRNDPAATTTSNHHAQTLQRFPAIGLVSHVGPGWKPHPLINQKRFDP